MTNAPATASTGTADKPFVYDGQRATYEAADVEQGGELLGKIAKFFEASPEKKVLAFEGQFPEGAGLVVAPLAKNVTTKVTDPKDGSVKDVTNRQVYAVIGWPIFPLEAVLAHPKGQQYLRDVINADQIARILQPLRKQKWEAGEFDTANCPKTLEDHIEGVAADRGVIKAYNEAATDFLKSFKKMNPAFAHFTAPILRQYLSSKALAMSFLPKLEEQGFWLMVIDKLEALTVAAGGNTEIYEQWRKTRDEATEINIDDMDLSALAV